MPIKTTPDCLVSTINTCLSNIMSSLNVSRRSHNYEMLSAPAPEALEVESPRQIRRFYTSAPNIEVPVTPPRSIFPSDGSEIRRGNFVSVTEEHDTESANQTIKDETPVQSDFNPAKLNPIILSFKETCYQLAACNLDQHVKFVRDTILRYSLAISGFPKCPDEDLMLAVYFYFEEKFDIKANFELCVRFDNHDQKNLVGVLLDSILTTEEILRKATGSKKKGSKIKIMHNGSLHWILDGFCGH